MRSGVTVSGSVCWWCGGVGVREATRRALGVSCLACGAGSPRARRTSASSFVGLLQAAPFGGDRSAWPDVSTLVVRKQR